MWFRAAIHNRLAQHARGIDRADEALLRAAYHDDGAVDYGSLEGSAAEFAAAIAAMHESAPMSSHRTSNQWIEVTGYAATSESYVMAWVTRCWFLSCGRTLNIGSAIGLPVVGRERGKVVTTRCQYLWREENRTHHGGDGH